MGTDPAGYLIAAVFAFSAAVPVHAAESCAPDRITFRAVESQASPPVTVFSAEVAADAASRARGLMERASMPLDHGMLFVFPKVAPVAFWMKNTPLPLDILFLDQSGTVCSIAANTTPYSLDLLASGCAVQTVFEVNAGQAAANGIGVGSVARHPAILDPAWPCK